MTPRRLSLASALLVAGLVVLLQLPGNQALRQAHARATDGAWRDAEVALSGLVDAPLGLRPSGLALYDAGVAAWYRAEDTPSAARVALAQWRAAVEQTPRDPVVQRDLARARALFDKRPPPVDDLPAWRAVLTPAELGLLTLLLWLACSGLAWRARRDPDLGPAPAWVLGGLALMLSITAWNGQQAGTEPVVVSHDRTAARLVPETMAQAEHHWPAGTELRVVDGRSDFVRVVDGLGSTGWVAVDAVTWPLGRHPDLAHPRGP